MLSVEDISLAANAYMNLPSDDVSMPDRVLWWTLRSIYEDFRRGTLSREDAVQKKQIAVQQHMKDAAQLTMFQELTQHQAEQWKVVERAAEQYAKSATGRTPEGDALFEALYGPVLTGVTQAMLPEAAT